MRQRHKRCTKCFIVKPITLFSKDKTGYMGHRANCKQCQNIQNKDCRDRRQNQNPDEKTHCWCCGVSLDTARQEHEQTRMKQQGPNATLPVCDVCQWKSAQTKTEIYRNRQPVKRPAADQTRFAELELIRAKLEGRPTRPEPPQPPTSDNTLGV